ncbi:hypothetical protein [Peribacillus kribbensis]|uniref:hypothetical protein n=1 Tax=Peribacillus kribbensis TaxID=356658 RepID=UPI00040D56EE|nr:hypothetical protein [Peribacillus kribbensis]
MFRGGTLWAGIISCGLDQFRVSRAAANGNLTKQQYAVNTAKNITGSIGLMAGLEYGAILGSAVMPGVGTLVGSFVGSVIGNRMGSSAGYHAGNYLLNGQSYNRQGLLESHFPDFSELEI